MTAPGPNQHGGARHVGLNVMWLVPGVVGGSEEYTTRLLSAIAAEVPADLELTLFVNSSFPTVYPELVDTYRTEVAPVSGRSKAVRVGAETTWLAQRCRRLGIGLVHHMGGILPAWRPSPCVLTIHDLQPLSMPENFSPVKRRWMATMLPRSAQRAVAVFTPSQSTSASVVERLGVAPGRVHTVPHGIEPPAPIDPTRVAVVRDRYQLGEQVILYPAITYPHKGHITLIRAFTRLARSRADVTLVLAGGAGPFEAEVVAAIRGSGVGHQVRRTGRIPEADLAAIYAASTVVAVPSEFEGFGAPALEAMAAGVPVVVSNTTSLPWVVGDAGLKVRPGDVGHWASELARVLDQPAAHDTLAAAGRVRAAQFTWDRAAASLATGYRLAASMGETGSS